MHRLERTTSKYPPQGRLIRSWLALEAVPPIPTSNNVRVDEWAYYLGPR